MDLLTCGSASDSDVEGGAEAAAFSPLLGALSTAQLPCSAAAAERQPNGQRRSPTLPPHLLLLRRLSAPSPFCQAVVLVLSTVLIHAALALLTVRSGCSSRGSALPGVQVDSGASSVPRVGRDPLFSHPPLDLARLLSTDALAQLKAASSAFQPLSFAAAQLNFSLLPGHPARPRFPYSPLDCAPPSPISSSPTPAQPAPPVVSVITAVYNVAELSVAESLLQSSFQQFEWILVDDASTDLLTRAEVARWKSLSDSGQALCRVRVLQLPENVGLPAARNAGARLSTAPVLVFADADDLLEPGYMEKCALFLHFHPGHSLCGGWVVAFGPRQGVWQSPGFASAPQLLYGNPLYSMTFMRRDAFEQVGGYNETLRTGMEDWDLWLHLLSAQHWGRTLPEPLYWYRTSDRSKWPAIAQPELAQRFRDDLRLRYSDLYQRHELGQRPLAPLGKLRRDRQAGAPVTAHPPTFNRLRRHPEHLRLLLLLDHSLRSDAQSSSDISLVRELSLRGWHVSVLIFAAEDPTDTALPLLRQWTADVFTLPHFLHSSHYAPHMAYFIQSRHPHVVLLSHTHLAYPLLPYVHAHTAAFDPAILFVDWLHPALTVDEEQRRLSHARQELLDLTLFPTQQQRAWAVSLGHVEQRTDVVHPGVDVDAPPMRDEATRLRVRLGLNLSSSTLLLLYQPPLLDEAASYNASTAVRVVEQLLVRWEWSLGVEVLLVGESAAAAEALERAMASAPSAVRSRMTLASDLEGVDMDSSLLSACDALLLPPTSLLLEGMARGLVPVVASDGVGAEVVEDGVSGCLIPRTSGERVISSALPDCLRLLTIGRRSLEPVRAPAVHHSQVERQWTREGAATAFVVAINCAYQRKVERFDAARWEDGRREWALMLAGAPQLQPRLLSLLDSTRLHSELIRTQLAVQTLSVPPA